MNIIVKYCMNLRIFAEKFVSLYQIIIFPVMDRDINRLKVVLAEKGGAARLMSVSWRDTREPISGWQVS